MMKKIIAAGLALTLLLGLAGCGGGTEKKTYEVAMITDVGTIDDKSFNQGTWEGIAAYCEKNKVSHKYYKPTEQSNDAYMEAIQLAVEGGAKIVVTPGYLFEEPIYKAQEVFPDVKFVLIDGKPHDAAFNYKIGDNTVAIIFAEEQSGYLAGYAAVKDGYTKLGFIGGMALPAVVRFGYGFAQGAEAAAAETGVSGVDLKYHYVGNFDATPETQTLASSWYAEGTEVIFVAAGAAGSSVMSAADAAGKKVIGVDVDQSGESDSVITSAMKGLAAGVQQALTDYYGDEFPGGKEVILTAAEDGVALPMKTSRFTKFTEEDYEKTYRGLVDGTIQINKELEEGGDPSKLSTARVKIEWIR